MIHRAHSQQRDAQSIQINHLKLCTLLVHLSCDSLMQIKAWEEEELDKPIDMEQIRIDPSPFQLVERTSLHKVTTARPG